MGKKGFWTSGTRPVKEQVTQFWDLSKPKMARDFLKNLRIGPKDDGRSITQVELADGRTVTFDEATDEEIVSFARQIAEIMGHGKKVKK